MLYTIVYKTKTEESEYSAVENHAELITALNSYYNKLTNVTADPSVLKFDIRIDNDDLGRYKEEHFARAHVVQGLSMD